MKIKLPKIKDRETDIIKRVNYIISYLYQLVRELETAFNNMDEKNINGNFLEEEREKSRLPVGSIILRKEGIDNAGMSYGIWTNIRNVQIEGEYFLLYRRNL